jgi:hypothetical protein
MINWNCTSWIRITKSLFWIFFLKFLNFFSQFCEITKRKPCEPVMSGPDRSVFDPFQSMGVQSAGPKTSWAGWIGILSFWTVLIRTTKHVLTHYPWYVLTRNPEEFGPDCPGSDCCQILAQKRQKRTCHANCMIFLNYFKLGNKISMILFFFWRNQQLIATSKFNK